MNDLGFVHRWVPGREGAATLLLLHGTGGSENDLVDLGSSVLPGAHLLSPRGQVDENGMLRFFRRLAEGVFDQEDLRLRTAQLAAFLEAARARYGFDPAKVIALGFSNGANLAASLLLSGNLTPQGHRALAGALLLHPMVPFEPESVPNLQGLDVFVGAGEQDAMVPVALTRQLESLLRAGGASVQTSWQPGGHRLSRLEIEAAQAWAQGERPWN